MEWTEDHIKHRQNMFCMTLKSCFLAKITKYQNLLRKRVHIDDCLELVTQPSEDEIELVLSPTHASMKSGFSLRKLGRQLTSAKLFQWILMLIQRVKARQVLAHLYDIPDVAIKTTILDVAWEVAISYEYQLMVLYGDEEIVKLAQHAVTCLMTYLNQHDARFTPANLLQALIEVKPKCSKNKEIVRTQPVLWNNESVFLKWKLCHILKQPGLRVLDEGRNHAHVLSQPALDELVTPETSQDELDEGHDDVDGSMIESVSDLLKCTINTADVNPTSQNLIELENVSSAILGHYTLNEEESDNEGRKHERRISALDMDFEEGTLRINDYTVEVNGDFSPVSHQDKNETSEVERLQISDGDEVDKANPEQISAIKNEDLIRSIRTYNDKSTHHISVCINPEKTMNTCTNDTYHTDSGASGEISIYFKKCADLTNKTDKASITKTIENKENDISVTNARNCSNSHTGMLKLETRRVEKNYKFYGCFTPYGAKCQPSIYGFRGPLHVWNDIEKKYTLIYNDRVTVNVTHCREITDANCVHQMYRPKTWCSH